MDMSVDLTPTGSTLEIPSLEVLRIEREKGAFVVILLLLLLTITAAVIYRALINTCQVLFYMFYMY